jgi:hypothetical protein
MQALRDFTLEVHLTEFANGIYNSTYVDYFKIGV